MSELRYLGLRANAAFEGLAVLALGGLTAWNLRNGFDDYLAARDVAQSAISRQLGAIERSCG